MSRVLVVDDEPLCRHGLAEQLRRLGAASDEATDGDDALRRFRRGEHTLVIADFAMPGLDGLGLLCALKRAEPATRVVLLTGAGSVATAVAALRAGAEDCLEKPVDRGRLRALLDDVAAGEDTAGLVTRTPAMRTLLAQARRIAPTGATVLIGGESGTGKEMVARAVHGWSRRAAGPFVAVNCAAIPDTLVESELFGHERGAFTDARAAHAGVIEQAHGGTLFLDEIGEMPLPAQAKLLRVLQDRSIRRIGAADTREVDVRFVAATNRPLREMVSARRFREDLYFRLNVLALALPPLRERRDDIVPLADHFARRWAAAYGRPVPRLAPAVLERLVAHPWPGNVRELENVVHRAVIEAGGAGIDLPHVRFDPLPGSLPAASLAGRSWAEVERELIVATLARVGGHRRRAAAMLGIAERTLRNRLRDYRMEPAP